MKRVLALGVVVLVLGLALAFFRPWQQRPRNVVLVMIDTLRADHLGAYGYERDTSPNLDQFARENLKFEYAITSAPWTPPAVASMFTGRYAAGHGMMPPNGRRLAMKKSAVLAGDNITVAELLSAKGYQTIGISPNPWIKKEFGYDQGFDTFIFRERARADAITRLAIRQIDALQAEKPFFMYVHYLDPHDPYDPKAPFDTMFNGPIKRRDYNAEMLDIIRRYDGEIRFTDHEIGNLFQHLKQKGLWEDTVIVVISDHGEQFKERGELGHGYRLFNEETHVALMLKAPGEEAREVSEVVSPVDVFPTIMNLSKTGSLKVSSDGVVLTDKDAVASRSGVLSEIRRVYNLRSFTRNDRKRLIVDYGDPSGDDAAAPISSSIYDAKTDPHEISDISDDQLSKELKLELDSLLSRAKESTIESDDATLSDETIEQLRSLGYLK
jgi:arylsulfatase A-like enzyme